MKDVQQQSVQHRPATQAENVALSSQTLAQGVAATRGGAFHRVWRSRVLRGCKVLGVFLASLFCLFLWNGMESSWRTPEFGLTTTAPDSFDGSLSIMAWNLAKCDFYEGGFKFKSKADVIERLDAISSVIRDSDVDLLFLSEVVFEAAPVDVNQVKYLAEAAGFHSYYYGDNYSYGIPGFRIRSGNALLSKYPLGNGWVLPLSGKSSVFDPTGVRRILFAEVELRGEKLLCGSVRNDSFSPGNNARQVAQILAQLKGEGALLAGDFNAIPGSPSMKALVECELFRGVFHGSATYPAGFPTRRIDTILVPSGWGGELAHSVLDVDLSDHEPVLVQVDFTQPFRQEKSFPVR